MYEDVVRRLRKIIKAHKEIYGGSTEESVAIEQAADAIEELDTLLDGVSADNDALCETIERLKKPHWISVAERLPEEDGMYLVHGVWSASGRKVTDTCEFYVHDGYFRTAWNFDVTHWLPLPTPPKGEE